LLFNHKVTRKMEYDDCAFRLLSDASQTAFSAPNS
jgi:hypothetical protein